MSWEEIKQWLQVRHLENEVLDHLADTVDPQIKKVRGYRNKLREPLAVCKEYSKELVATIPGPILADRKKWSASPQLKALLAGSENPEQLLAAEQGSEPANYLLLTMTRTDRTIFGREKRGEMVVGDAKMQTVTFTDHKVFPLGATETEARAGLEQLSIETIILAASRKLVAVLAELSDLYQQQSNLKAMSRMFGEGGRSHNVFGVQTVEQKEKLEKVTELLEETTHDLEQYRSKLETPKQRLESLAEYLSQPEKILTSEPFSVVLDWRNVIVDKLEEKAVSLALTQFSLPDEMQRYGVLVGFEL
ncbi:MAG: hypothetical protein HKP44_09960 [Desulfofustis sp.]|nr:hypothetical protein [Desulfofustis sp.]